jgi:hypothetical protein
MQGNQQTPKRGLKAKIIMFLLDVIRGACVLTLASFASEAIRHLIEKCTCSSTTQELQI